MTLFKTSPLDLCALFARNSTDDQIIESFQAHHIGVEHAYSALAHCPERQLALTWRTQLTNDQYVEGRV